MSRVFVSGGSGVIGRPLVERLLAQGDEVVALGHSDESASVLRALGAEVVPGELLDEKALSVAMRGCAIAFNVAGVNSLCPDDPGPMMRTNADGPAVVVRAAARAEVRRLVHTSSAATIGEPRGTVGREDTAHRGWYLSTYERSKSDGERVAFRLGRETGVEVVCVNPASVQGPGRSGGTGRFLLAFLDGRLKVFVATNVSLVDIADCVEGHLLAADRGTAGQRYLLSGITMTIADALMLAAEEAGVRAKPRLVPRPAAITAAYAVEQAFRLMRSRPPICQEMVRTLLHGHRYDGSRATSELGLRYTSARETLRRTIEWARAAGLMRAA